ncbi:MAG: HAMP domain-containing histidine kinase [Chloroflexi bacterium]|nr:HAMP domain-containing histidine kinase [Chloroflexota bacterium]
MRVGRFIKRLINPEIDQAEDRSAGQAFASGDNLPPAREKDDDSPGSLFATEEELQEAGIDPAALFEHESREEESHPEQEPEPETEQNPEQKPEPEDREPAESSQQGEPEDDGPVASSQKHEPEENLPEPEPEPEKPELSTAPPQTDDEFSLAKSAVNSSFIITLAQELRAPITSLKVSYELLKDPNPVRLSAAETKRLLENIERSISRLERQTSDLLEIGYLRSGSLNLITQPVDLTEPILAAIDISRPAAAQRHVAIELDLQPDLPTVFADGYRLTQVMTHLLSNAIKFTPVRGSVVITVETGFSDFDSGAENRQKTEDPAPDLIIARVIDHGPGVREAHLELIFEPFYRISGEGIEGGAGVGLGLAIVKGLIELHSGTVWVKSAPGEVTEFGFSIPIA